MSGFFHVKIMLAGGLSRRMPCDSDMARDFADAITEVRLAFEEEAEAKLAGRPLAERQIKINQRKEMEERAVLLFRTILSGIPEYCAEHPIAEVKRGRPPLKQLASGKFRRVA